jgi:hypothetical protein
LYTSRYQSRHLAEPGTNLVAVRTTLYPPRFPLGYELRYRIAELAPTHRLFKLEGAEFDQLYVQHLDRIGVDVIEARFAEIVAAEKLRGNDRPALVLCCFEQAARDCHRSTFAAWWLLKTGEEIPELPV